MQEQQFPIIMNNTLHYLIMKPYYKTLKLLLFFSCKIDNGETK